LWDHFCLPRFHLYSQKIASFACISLVTQKIAEFKFLERVDLSYNCLNTLKHLNGLKFLTSIKAANNQLTNVLDIKEAPLSLDYLDLSSNRISNISELGRHKFLRVLKLNSNKITSIKGLSKNKALRVLDLSENVIE